MTNLLSAGFSRLFKNRTFYICVIVMALYGVLSAISVLDDPPEFTTSLDEIFFEYCSLIPVLMSVFCAMFIGTEYSDGTMRNKLITGHKRATVYMSNYIIGAAAGLMMYAACIVTCLGFGLPTLGFFAGDIGMILVRIGCSLTLLLAVTGIFTLVSLIVRSKPASAVICIILAFAMLITGAVLYSLLQVPEYSIQYTHNNTYVEIDENFNQSDEVLSQIKSEYVPNPFYVGGAKRQIYQFIIEFTPGGQAILIISNDVKNPLLLSGYSVLVAVVTTAAGIIIFNKKNLN